MGLQEIGPPRAASLEAFAVGLTSFVSCCRRSEERPLRTISLEVFAGGLSSWTMGFPSIVIAVDGKNKKTVTDGLVGGVRGGFIFVEGGVRSSNGEPPQMLLMKLFAVGFCSREAVVGRQTQIPPLTASTEVFAVVSCRWRSLWTRRGR